MSQDSLVIYLRDGGILVIISLHIYC